MKLYTPPKLTAGARIGKGIQDIEICKNLAFSIADWTDWKRTLPSAVSEWCWLGQEKLKNVQERLMTEGQHRLFLFSVMYFCLTHVISLSTCQFLSLLVDDMYLLGNFGGLKDSK